MNLIAGANIKFDWIKTDDELARLQQFAAGFDHRVARTPYPLVAMRMGNRSWHGYAQVYTGPLVLTAWHKDPSICSPRDVVESFKALAGWAKLQFGGGFTGVPTGETRFTPEVMTKLGFTRHNTELYEILA